MKVFDLITGKNTIQEKIIENTELFRESMTKNNFRIAGDNHPICPVMIGDAKIAAQFAENLLSEFSFAFAKMEAWHRKPTGKVYYYFNI